MKVTTTLKQVIRKAEKISLKDHLERLSLNRLNLLNISQAKIK